MFFYVHFSGRLAYTFLNAGFYLAAIVSIGVADPSAALPEGKAFFLADDPQHPRLSRLVGDGRWKRDA